MRSNHIIKTHAILAWLEILLFAWAPVSACRTQADQLIRVDCSKIVGEIRALHGVNGGVLNDGETVDLTTHWKALSIPVTRLHDCEWPRPDVVDIHAVFPNLQADPHDPESYQFSATDDFIQAIVDTGAQIVYRLGESIEHSRQKQYAHPPNNSSAWAEACLGIIRHYNHGWANGFYYNIRYWEIWNEPENRPAMWSGDDQDYYRLYVTAAKTIKAKYPTLRIGGPSVGAIGNINGESWQPTTFLRGFLQACRVHDAPLNFFSWHTYTNEPFVYVRKARALRRWLDEEGFEATELHLNEWNYLPDNDWTPMLASSQGYQRQEWFKKIGGMPGAAFTACVLSYLQDCPIDVANYYSGDTNHFSLFNRYGVPRKSFYAMQAFRRLLDTPLRLATTGWRPDVNAVCAGVNSHKNQVSVLLSFLRKPESACRLEIHNLPWGDRTAWAKYVVDGNNNLNRLDQGFCQDRTLHLDCSVSAPTVCLITCHPAPQHKHPLSQNK
jgi:xylan 1,4-beta-xylosidase